jgi:prolyl-tRNA synthetase
MRQTKLFGKTTKDISQEEKSINAELLIRAGFVAKQMAGVYNYLPLGLRTYRKIENIIRQAMEAIGGQEILMSALQPKELWQQTGRWQELEPIMYQFKDHHGSEVGLATTHEEVVTDIVKKHLSSYKDLPLYLYQIQNKFRDEKRVKSGLLRGREFSMKDLYSFHANEEDLDKYYQLAHGAYLEIFKKLGLEAFSVEASGGAMSQQFSHEFMVVTEAGEDLIRLCQKCGWAQNAEISEVKEGGPCPKCQAKVKQLKTVEAGNIFRLGTKYSQALGLQYTDAQGQVKEVLMGSYGLGLGRIMGTIVEASHDEKGIIWTKTTTPFHVHLLNLAKNDKTSKQADGFYETLTKAGWDVLYDDRDLSFARKLKDADLIGICWQVIISDKQTKLELKNRQTGQQILLVEKELNQELKKYYQS